MTIFDLTNFNMISGSDINFQKDSFDHCSVKELVSVYKALTDAIDVCLSCPETPYCVYTLASIQYAYSTEIVNRLLFASSDEDLNSFKVSFDAVPSYFTND